jgi:serine/threonine protein kinase
MGQDGSTDVKVDSAARTACHKCKTVVDTSVLTAFSTATCPNCGATFTTPGRLGPYVLLKELGLGLMGATYKGFEKALGRYVTIKIMSASLGRDTKRIKAFLAEGRALARLDHPNAVRVFSIGEEKHQPYIVMELVNGQSMGRMLASGEPLEETLVLEIATGVARALRAAGKVGLIHGDVKPDNIVLDERGRVKLVDFRIARFGSAKVQADAAVDMPYYAAPEQIGSTSQDFRSDIYSLGATLFHGLAGVPPFSGGTDADVLRARLEKPAPNLISMRRGLEPYTIQIVAKMLERDPASRYQSYDELLGDLGKACLAAGVESALEADADRPPERRPPRRASPGKILAVAAAILIVGFVVWAIFLQGGPQTESVVQVPGTAGAVRSPAPPGSTPKSTPRRQLASPTFPSRRRTSNGEIEIVISCPARNADIHYTTDGSEPTRKSWKWNGRLVVKPGATLRARSFLDGWRPSGIAKAVIKPLPPPAAVAIRKPHKVDPRDIKEHRGFIMTWVVAGPYSGQPGPGLFNVAFGPEKNDKSVVWRPLAHRADHWALDLNATVSKADNCAVYVRTRVHSPIAQAVRLELGSDDAVKVWLNRRLVHGMNKARGLTAGNDIVRVNLSAGWNVLMLKVIDHSGDWGFCCRIRKPDGKPLRGLKIEAK